MDDHGGTELPETEGYSDYLTEEAGVSVVAEDSDRRELEVKHFRMTDGSSRAAVYSHAVHYLENGLVWKSISG